jgi:hypothetical protein
MSFLKVKTKIPQTVTFAGLELEALSNLIVIPLGLPANIPGKNANRELTIKFSEIILQAERRDKLLVPAGANK